MRKPFALVAIVLLGLSLSGCGTAAPTKVKTVTTPTPTASATPTAAPVAKAAEPSRTTPLIALTDPDILAYCPNQPATHFTGKASDVTKIVICTSVASATGSTESASSVNFGSDALLSAYGAANAKVTKDTCTRVATDPLVIWITGADKTIKPVYAPVDPCGYPSADAVAAYQSAGLQILWEADLDANGNPTTP